MRKTTVFICLLVTFNQYIYTQDDCKKSYQTENYIPKNLHDAIAYLNCVWPESDKTEFKNNEEHDAVAELHFGTGMGIRNGWGLWKGKNRITRFFKSKGISHPDDMSSIILTSFHRHLNNKPINLDEQIKYYKAYWEELEYNKKNITKKVKKLKVGDVLKIPLSGRHGWRTDGTNKTTLNVYHYTVEDTRDFDCIIEGTVISKRKVKKSNYVTIEISHVEKCAFEKPIYNSSAVSIGEQMEINLSISKIIFP